MTQKGNGDGWSGDWPEEVGYKKPPMSTRFRPGQSGNPKGRPKKKESLHEIADRVFKEPVTVVEGGIRKRMSRIEVIVRNGATRANKDSRAMAELLKLAQDCETATKPFKVNTLTIKLVEPDKPPETPPGPSSPEREVVSFPKLQLVSPGD